MTRIPRDMPEMSLLLAQITAVGETAPSLEQKLQMLEAIRGQSADRSRLTDRVLIEQLCSVRAGLLEASKTQEELRGLLMKLTAPPFHPGIFLGTAEVGTSYSALVMHGNVKMIVPCADEVDITSLEPGDEVLLSHELNFIVARSPFNMLQCGHTGFFDRYTPDGRIILKDRDEEIVVEIAAKLRNEALKQGDQIRWERNSWMALEKVERSKADALFLEETPSETFESIGGLDLQIEKLQRSIRLHLFHSEIAGKYRLRRVGSVLLHGPTGTGKTTMARALTHWLATLSKSGRARFMHIKPLELSSMWYSESERNVRNTFRMAREAGDEEPEVPVVMFFDEVDSIGSARGASLMGVDDKVLTALMAELDGLESRGNILVVAATNRRDALDPALMREGRLGDVQIEIPRPNMKAAGEIFGKHLHPSIPYALGDHAPGEARRYLIQSAVSTIYSPNGNNELVQIGFRDGKRRTIKASELISGASIAKIVRIAMENACLREAERGLSGVQLEDILHGLAEEFECLAKSLTPANCRLHLSDLPQDVDVVRVEPVIRQVSHIFQYVNAA